MNLNQAPFTFSRQFLASCSCQHVAWTLPFAQHIERRRHLSSVASQKTSREAFDILHNILMSFLICGVIPRSNFHFHFSTIIFIFHGRYFRIIFGVQSYFIVITISFSTLNLWSSNFYSLRLYLVVLIRYTTFANRALTPGLYYNRTMVPLYHNTTSLPRHIFEIRWQCSLFANKHFSSDEWQYVFCMCSFFSFSS